MSTGHSRFSAERMHSRYVFLYTFFTIFFFFTKILQDFTQLYRLQTIQIPLTFRTEITVVFIVYIRQDPINYYKNIIFKRNIVDIIYIYI